PGAPAEARRYLINPWGLNYEEVTASNLVKVDTAGAIVGEASHGVNPAGFVIHGAIHAARADAHCVIHTHTTTGMAVACKAGGLRHDNFYSAQLAGRVAYHEFEGVAVHDDERPRLVASLGDRDILILRNHGLLVVGAEVATAYWLLWTLQRACDVQALADSMLGPNAEIAAGVAQRCAEDAVRFDPQIGALWFHGALRRHRIRYADLVE
ncbi:MAG: class II aldolase/adducin family protein, partial [Burkholderiales bacterium]